MLANSLFTALHEMHTRSVCPQTRGLWQNGRNLSRFFYTIYERSFSL